jgi:hypothetical protein
MLRKIRDTDPLKELKERRRQELTEIKKINGLLRSIIDSGKIEVFVRNVNQVLKEC